MSLTNKPLNGGNRTKIIMFFAFLILPLAWFGGSIPIIMIAVSALYIMKKDQDFTPIIKSKIWIQIYLFIILSFLFSIINYVVLDERNLLEIERWKNSISLALVISGVATFCLTLLFDYLFFKPLEEHKDWVIKNSIFSDGQMVKKTNKHSLNIIGRDNLSSYSVADEILKWNDLLDKGLITKEQFEKTKTKIMNGEKI